MAATLQYIKQNNIKIGGTNRTIKERMKDYGTGRNIKDRFNCTFFREVDNYQLVEKIIAHILKNFKQVNSEIYIMNYKLLEKIVNNICDNYNNMIDFYNNIITNEINKEEYNIEFIPEFLNNKKEEIINIKEENIKDDINIDTINKLPTNIRLTKYGTYRVQIRHVEHGTYKTLKEAILVKEKIISNI